MTSGQKIAFSTLLSMLLFAGFVITANLKLFPELETRFYAQTKVSQKLQHLDEVAENFDSYISNILKKADDFAKTPCVASFIEQNPSEKSVIDRRNRIEKLFNEVPPLTGLRIVDKNGRNVHYSSFDKTDLLKQNGITKVYKNYIDIQRDLGELDFSVIKTDGAQKVLVDSRRSRLIISEPFYWFDDIQNGDIFFYLNLYDIREAFVSKNVFSYGEGFSIYNDDALAGGIALGVPLNAQEDFKIPVLSSWKKEKAAEGGGAVAAAIEQPAKIVSSSDGEYWTILSAKAAKYLKISGIYRSSNFELSKDLIWLIYTCVFITIFLLLYLIFSLGQDSLSLARKKIKKLQAGIIQEYLERKQDIEWSKIAQALRLRKSDFLNDLSEGLSKKNRRHKKEIDELLEKAWNDIIEVFEKQENARPVQTVVQREEINLSEIRNVIEEVLGSKLASVQALAQKPASAPVSLQNQVDEVEEIEEVEEVDDLEDVEEIEEVAELDEADELEEVEELEEPEPVEEVTETEQVDELEDAEEVEELQEEVEELPEEEVEELEDLQKEEELESLDDIQEAEELEEVSEEPESQGPIEELPEYDEFIGERDVPYEDEGMTFYSVDNILPGRDEYLEDTDAFIRSDRFASVTNLFAEEITLGDEYDTFTKRHPSNVINNFKVHKLSDMFTEKTDLENDGILAGSEELLEDIADLTEEVPPAEGKPYFAMTDFAKKDDIEALEEVADRDHVIFENNGVFQIAKNLDYSAAQYNTEFKALVDSVLHN